MQQEVNILQYVTVTSGTIVECEQTGDEHNEKKHLKSKCKHK